MTSNYVVHISEIPEGVKESDVKNYFNEKLGIDCRIGSMRPVKNQEIPLQWARVDLRSDEAYTKAVEELRFPQFVPGISSRLLPNDRDIISKDIAEKNVFVKGLDKAKYDNEELYELFKQFGAIDASKVSKTVKKEDDRIIAESNGYGFVKFSDVNKAKEVVEKAQLDDKDIKIEPYLKERKKAASNNLYIKNFPASYGEEELKGLFEKYGEITSAKVMVDENSGKKFGYVCFKDQESADAALEMHDSPIDDELRLYVQRHEKKSVRREELVRKFKKQNLFVTNFSENVDEGILRDFFSQYGTIRNVKILMKKSEINGEIIESSKCKGFVCFENPEDARKVLDESKNNGIWFDSKRLNISMFEPRSERVQANAKGTASGNPELDNIIMQFLQTMSSGGMMGGLPMMNNPPMPVGMNQPRGGGYHNKMAGRQPRNDMYNRPPQPNPSSMQSYAGGFNNMMGGPSMPMMQPNYQDNYGQKMMPPTSMGGGMMASPPTSMPPINAMTEENLYAHSYNELVKSEEYMASGEDEKKNKIGDLIYPYVERKAGPDAAPKITGMIIDLELEDLEASTESLHALNEKVSEGLSLLEDES